MNTIESIRVKVGLTKPQMMRLLGTNSGNVILKSTQALAVFSLSDAEVVERIERRTAGTPSSLIARAIEIEEKYDRWSEEVVSRLESVAATSPDNYLRTRDVARVLGISDFHLSQLRIRGRVEAEQESQRRYVYTLESIMDLVKNNSKTITPDSKKTRGPLTNAFLSWASEDTYESERDERELIPA